MSWWPGVDTDIGIVFFLAAAVIFVCGIYKMSGRIFGKKMGEKVAEFILGIFALFGLLKGCGIL